MKTTVRILIIVVSTALLGVATPNDGAEPAPDPAGIYGADAELTAVINAAIDRFDSADPAGIYGADAKLTAVINAAIDRFDSADLTLEPLRIEVHPTDEDCSGYHARFSTDNEVDRVDLCTGRTPHIVLHELAHAWAHHNLTDEARQTFLDHTGLAWNDPDVDWRRRGIEVVANTVAWGLRDTPLTDTDARNHAEILRRFELVTGMPSPRLPPPDG